MERDGVGVGRAYLGIEIDELAARVVVTQGKVRPERQWRARFQTPPDPATFIHRVAEGVHEMLGANEIAGIGVASWVSVDSERGVILDSSAMPEWAGVSITTSLRESLGAPVVARAGVDAAALAEAKGGAGKDATPMIYIHLGREVLSSLVYNGAPALGAHGRAGQIGHWRVTENGPRCACGATGHLNPLCSSQSIVRLAIGLAAQDEKALAAVHEATGGRAEALTAGRVVALASAGVEPLRELVIHSADALGQALAQLSLVIHPAMIVLGGPLGTAGGLFMERTRWRLAEETRALPFIGEAPRLSAASLEPQSALTGAWLLGSEAQMG